MDWRTSAAVIAVAAALRCASPSPPGAPLQGSNLPDAGGPASGPDGGNPGRAPPGGQTAPNTLTPGIPPGIDRLTTGEKAVALAVDGERLYWLSQLYGDAAGENRVLVRSSLRGGGNVSTLALVDGIAATNLFVDDEAVYFDVWTCGKDPTEPFPCSVGAGSGGHLRYRARKLGGAERFADSLGVLLGVDAANVYVSRHADFSTGSIDAIPKAGTSSIPFSDHLGTSLVLTASDFYWLDVTGLRHRAQGTTTTDTVALPANFGMVAVDGGDFYLRGGPSDNQLFFDSGIYFLPAAGGSPRLVWKAPFTPAPALAASKGRVFWNQSPSPLDGFPGCAGTANRDQGRAFCIDRGMYSYGDVRVSGNDLFYLRNGDVFRAPVDASEDPDATDGEWAEQGTSAPSGGGPASGSAVLVTGETIGALALDDDNVYWTKEAWHFFAPPNFTLRAVRKAGGAPTTMAALPEGSDGELEASGGWLFWNHSRYLGSFPGLRRLSTHGGAIEWLGAAYRLAVDGNWIYFQREVAGPLERVDLSGHGRADVASANYVGAFTASLGELIFIDDTGFDRGVFLRAAAEDGSGSRTIAELSSGSNLGRLAADANHVYWIQNGRLSRVPRSGGPILDLLGANDFDVRAGRVYVSEDTWNGSGYGTGCVWGMDPDGANRVCLESSSEKLGTVRADDRSVFFVRGRSLVRVDRR